MPAVTADTLALPKIAAPTECVERPVKIVSTSVAGFEGEGFPVHRAFAGVPYAELDPFIMMDQMGEVDYAPFEPRGTDWHPHRGFETVTYIIDGTFRHQDSHGGGGVIADGGTQWMTAGSGILHIETPPEELVVSGGLFHGIQLWVNLPSRDKMIAPRYQNLDAELVRLLASSDGGALVRLIAGDLGGHVGPGSTYTPITVAHATIEPGEELVLPWRAEFNALAYVLSGSGIVGAERRPVSDNQLVVFGPGDRIRLAGTGSRPLEVMLLGGRPINEPIAQYGPFVMNTRTELAQAVDDFNAGRFGLVPADGLHPYRPTGR